MILYININQAKQIHVVRSYDEGYCLEQGRENDWEGTGGWQLVTWYVHFVCVVLYVSYT